MSSLDTRAIDDKELKEAPAPAAHQEFRIYLAEGAFDRAVARGGGDTTREIGGVLVGEVLRDASGPYLRVDTTIDALHAEEKGAELTFTHATWAHIHEEMDEHHEGKRVVGWYHTHPGFGVFLSDRDQFIHKSFFNLPFQIALVYDPKSREHGVFTWHDNEVRRARRYFVGEREQTWDGARTTETPDRAAAAPSASMALKALAGEKSSARVESREPDDEPLLPMTAGTMFMLAAVLVVLAGFVGHWLGASSGDAAIAAAQGELDKAKQEGVQLAIAQLQTDLVGVLRDTLGDAALHKPVGEAIAAIDGAIAALSPPALGSGAGSGSANAGSASANAGSVEKLQHARAILQRLLGDRSSEESTLAAIARASSGNAQLKADLSQEVAELRAASGGAYSELAITAQKLGDKDRARRLLTTAARLDPGNRARYEQQLKAFDPSATLPAGGAP